MEIIIRAFLFLLSAWLLWFFVGILIEAVNAVAKRYNHSGFTVAFFVLGLLTSVAEVAVMVSSSIDGVPQVAAGTLIGAAVVLLFFIIPLLAILGGEVRLKNTLSRKQLITTLVVIVLPVLLTLDGSITKLEGVIILLSYIALTYLIQHGKWWWQRKHETVPEILEELEEELTQKMHATRQDIVRIVTGGVFIFIAGYLLVDESVFFGALWGIPNAVLGLLILPIGTNMAEIVIAVRSIQKGSLNIAFGNYLGSAVAKALIFGILAIWQGTYLVASGQFYAPAILLFFGSLFFYIFANSKDTLSRSEGLTLFSFYILFILSQFALLWFSVA